MHDLNNMFNYKFIFLLLILAVSLKAPLARAQTVEQCKTNCSKASDTCTDTFNTCYNRFKQCEEKCSSSGSRTILPSKSPSSGSSQPITIPNPLGVRTFADLIKKITNWLLVLGAPIVTLMSLIGGFQIMTAAGDPEKFITGRKTITYAVVGYGLLLISTGLIALIQNVLGAR